MAPHERGALIERGAKALCRFRHTPRSVEEAVAPGRELWMRYIPDAEVAIEAMNLPAPEARECKKCNAPHCFCEGSAGSKRPEGEEIKPVATDGVLVVLSNGTSWIHKNGAWVKYDPQPQLLPEGNK